MGDDDDKAKDVDEGLPPDIDSKILFSDVDLQRAIFNNNIVGDKKRRPTDRETDDLVDVDGDAYMTSGDLPKKLRIDHLVGGEYKGRVTNYVNEEGNLLGILIGKAVHPRGVIYASKASHISILQEKNCVVVNTFVIGGINHFELKEKLCQNKKRPAIIYLNIGSTIDGALDDIDMVIQALIDLGFTRDRFYIHCDCSILGLMMPFVLRIAPKVTLKKPIGSVSVSWQRLFHWGDARSH